MESAHYKLFHTFISKAERKTYIYTHINDVDGYDIHDSNNKISTKVIDYPADLKLGVISPVDAFVSAGFELWLFDRKYG